MFSSFRLSWLFLSCTAREEYFLLPRTYSQQTSGYMHVSRQRDANVQNATICAVTVSLGFQNGVLIVFYLISHVSNLGDLPIEDVVVPKQKNSCSEENSKIV